MYVRFVAMVLVCLVPVIACGNDASKSSDSPGDSDPSEPDAPVDGSRLTRRTELDGQYVGALEITGGHWTGIGAGDTIRITFQASGMSGIGQFEIKMSTDPAIMFDLAQSRFAPEPPFITMGAGLEQQADGTLHFVGADLHRGSNGTRTLGTLELVTGTAFTPQTQVLMPVTYFSMGPTMAERSSFERDPCCGSNVALNLGVMVNDE